MNNIKFLFLSILINFQILSSPETILSRVDILRRKNIAILYPSLDLAQKLIMCEITCLDANSEKSI